MKRRRIEPGAHEYAVRMAQVLPVDDRRHPQWTKETNDGGLE